MTRPPSGCAGSTGPFILRRLKTDRAIIADLPEKIEMKVLLQPDARAGHALPGGRRRDARADRVERGHRAARAGAGHDDCASSRSATTRRSCSRDGSALAGRSGKLERLEEMLEEVLAEGDRALLFTQFAEIGALLRDAPARAVRARGPVPARRDPRRPSATRWSPASRTTDGPPILVLSLKAGGTGLNLTAANHVVPLRPLVEPRRRGPGHRPRLPHRPAAERAGPQARLRRHARGADRRDASRTKRALADRVVGTGETWLTELSTDELRDLVALSADAVAEG